ncbi:MULTISPECIES: hypothetical protein [unclassified Pseudomonas]|uniref:hypothetical protein n=1 Tax=unclassified Pseudomonas TaxID=196821 RepID=UPI0011AA23C7|nr:MULTISPECIES: hypothetical protein [unclassified Pseudomonas]TWC12130.1 hypothetical protein FBY00_12785 [Pseudomonas sp. SJZ075]TWC28699.1 hypothetical protein FBY02_12885 [Pseudomonas sp. SJZ078]TWC48879.1 hypothetical protein FBY11_12785 [Pseudomonas sp. SJZ124]TWC84489.1 hypothetical protein FBY09_1271 [Pseudomonas sp. SJZ101]
MRAWTAAALLALAGATNAWAGEDYRCTIESTVAAKEKPINRIYIDKQFTVERQTGLMAGVLKNSYVTDPQVVDYGSTENSYKVVVTMRRDQGAGVGSSIYALTINEYDEGDRKPFIFLQNDEAFLGWCEHF